MLLCDHHHHRSILGMVIFPIIQVLSVLLNLTHGLNETNSTSQLKGLSSQSSQSSKSPISPLPSSSPQSAKSELQPYPLGHHPSTFPLISNAQNLKPKSTPASPQFPYLMSRPVFTEIFKSTQQESGEHKKSKESDSGWKQENIKGWTKHGDEAATDKQHKSNNQGYHTDGSHKKSLGHDKKDASEKWKQGTEFKEHEDEKLVEEYNKNKGRMFEKKWSWEKERGSGHKWDNEGKHDQEHMKGGNNREYESGMKGNQGKDAWSQEKEKSNSQEDNWGDKFVSKGKQDEDKFGYLKQALGSNQHDANYLRQLGYHKI